MLAFAELSFNPTATYGTLWQRVDSITFGLLCPLCAFSRASSKCSSAFSGFTQSPRLFQLLRTLFMGFLLVRKVGEAAENRKIFKVVIDVVVIFVMHGCGSKRSNRVPSIFVIESSSPKLAFQLRRRQRMRAHVPLGGPLRAARNLRNVPRWLYSRVIRDNQLLGTLDLEGAATEATGN